MIPLNWPDSGHAFSYTGLQPTGHGAISYGHYGESEPPAAGSNKSDFLLSEFDTGNLASITELGKCLGPGPAKLQQ